MQSGNRDWKERTVQGALGNCALPSVLSLLSFSARLLLGGQTVLANGQLKETEGTARSTFLSSFEHLSQEYQDERALPPLLLDFYATSFPLFYFHIKYENTKYKIHIK